jgi:hypothetical protein
MTVVFVIGITVWLGILLMVFALCVSASRGDALIAAHVDRKRRRRGRFGRGPHVRLIPRTRAH